MNRYQVAYDAGGATYSFDRDYEDYEATAVVAFEGDGPLTEVDFEGTVSTIEWNPQGDWTRYHTEWSGGGETVNDLSYEYDGDRVVAVEYQVGNAPDALYRTDRWAFTWDGEGNVVEMLHSGWMIDGKEQWSPVMRWSFDYDCWLE